MGGGFWHEGILELYSDGFYGCRRMAGVIPVCLLQGSGQDAVS